MNRISWTIPVDAHGFEDVVLSNTQIKSDVNEATETVFESIALGFNLSRVARDGIAERLGGLRALYREGEVSKKPEDAVQMPLGKLTLAQTTRVGGNIHDYRLLPQSIYLTSASFKEEIENLHSSAREFSAETAHDENASKFEHGIAEFADDHEAIVSEAVKLAISRRMLKYGVLPSEILSSHLRETMGFDTWFEAKIQDEVDFKNLSKARQNLIIEQSRTMYANNNVAARNMRKTIWPKIFRRFLPFDAELNQMFFTYYLNRLVSNSGNTLVFNDELTARLADEEVAEGLENIYAPTNFALRIVK